MRQTEAPKIDDIRAAQSRIQSHVLRTPLVPLRVEALPCEIFLKLENLQPIGSFKIRGASNALQVARAEEIAHGVYTASAGNMAQGLAWVARELGVACSVVVPDHAPRTKLEAIERLGASVIKVSFDDWWQVLMDHEYPGLDGFFVHPVSNPQVMAGNGVIGLEILEDLPEVDAVLVPFGGGGLSSGIATAIRADKPDTRVLACEVETAAPLSASLAAGRPSSVHYTPSFVDGIGGKSVLEEMWPLVSNLLDGVLVVSLDEIADAIRLLVERNRVIAEGAGAASVAAARSGKAGSGKVVCVISGGNLDTSKLQTILAGNLP